MAETGSIRPIQPQPNRSVLQPGDRGARALSPLRAQQPVIMSQYPGGPSAISLVMVPMRPGQIVRNVAKPGPRIRLLDLVPPILQIAGLVHTRALGNPSFATTITLGARVYGSDTYGFGDYGSPGVGLAHARAIGSPSVTAPPVIPPVVIPPVTPPATPVHTPRNLRYVERRNKPPRN